MIFLLYVLLSVRWEDETDDVASVSLFKPGSFPEDKSEDGLRVTGWRRTYMDPYTRSSAWPAVLGVSASLAVTR